MIKTLIACGAILAIGFHVIAEFREHDRYCTPYKDDVTEQISSAFEVAERAFEYAKQFNQPSENE